LWGIFRTFVVMKVYLKTPTSELSTAQLRRIVREAIKYCEVYAGVKKSRQRTLKYQVLTLPSNCSPAYGQYDYNANTIRIFRNHAQDVKMVIRGVLHEYCHFLQNLRHYDTVLKKVGYDKHPLEGQARAMEMFYSQCWNNIKNKI